MVFQRLQMELLGMDAGTEFNKKIAMSILSDLQQAKNLKLSFDSLNKNISDKLIAVDSTFPVELREVLLATSRKIHDHQQDQYAATLNTDDEGTNDGKLPVGGLFDLEIKSLEKYIGRREIFLKKLTFVMKKILVTILQIIVLLLCMTLMTKRCIDRQIYWDSLKKPKTTNME